MVVAIARLLGLAMERRFFMAQTSRKLKSHPEKTLSLALTKLIERANSLIPAHRHVDINHHIPTFSHLQVRRILST
jgi:ABC-type transport system involved in Fe-S cluster assembly fused permease/ATPase subunit